MATQPNFYLLNLSFGVVLMAMIPLQVSPELAKFKRRFGRDFYRRVVEKVNSGQTHNQAFGNALVEENTITQEQLDAILNP